MGRKLRTTVPVVPSSLFPPWSHFQDTRNAQCENMQRQKKACDKRRRMVDLRLLKPGEHIWVKYINRRGSVKTRMQAPPRSYVVKTQHGDVRLNRRNLNLTPVAPKYDALPADVDVPIDLNGGAEEPMAVAAPPAREPQPPEPRRNPAIERNMPAYSRDHNVSK